MNKNLNQINTAGSSLKFHLENVSYHRMVTVLGLPNVDDDTDSVDASWGVEHDDGRRLFAWNYKNGEAFLGDKGKNWKCQVGHWSMDGDLDLAVELFGADCVT